MLLSRAPAFTYLFIFIGFLQPLITLSGNCNIKLVKVHTVKSSLNSKIAREGEGEK